MDSKRNLGQYYTLGNPFGHPAFIAWAAKAGLPQATVLEPFAGANFLIDMLREQGMCQSFLSYDLAPNHPDVAQRDTLADFPHGHSVVVTNPPYLARNSAKRRGLAFPETTYDDLYKHALAITLAHVPWVAAIVPDSLFTAGVFLERAQAFVSLPQSMFSDTEHPVCLALFGPADVSGDPELWAGERLLGRLADIQRALPNPTHAHPWVFNDPHGAVGLLAVDSQEGPTIRFVDGTTIPSTDIKHSSRAITRIGAPFLAPAHIPTLLAAANATLARMRADTGDALMTSFKGLRKDGRYRRRLDFAAARRILDTAMEQL